MERQITVFTDPQGMSQVSLTESMLAWRLKYKGNLHAEDGQLFVEGVCKLCDGDGVVKTDLGLARCLCRVLEAESLFIPHRGYASTVADKSLKDIQIWGTSESQDALIKLIDAAVMWAEWPDKWLTITGSYGIGKTHVLHYLANQYNSWAVYITDTDFRDRVFQATGEGTVDHLIRALKYIPILLYDDYGSAYVASGRDKERDYARSTFRSILDFRYSMWKDKPTVVTSNKTENEIRLEDGRVGDRLFDRQRVTHIEMGTKVKSWRARDGR